MPKVKTLQELITEAEQAKEAELKSTSEKELLCTETNAKDIETDETDLKDLKAKEDEIDAVDSASNADTTEHLVDEEVEPTEAGSEENSETELDAPTNSETELDAPTATELLGTETDAEDIKTDELEDLKTATINSDDLTTGIDVVDKTDKTVVEEVEVQTAGSNDTSNDAELDAPTATELLGTETDAEDIKTDEDSLKDLKAKEDEIDTNASASVADTTEHLVDEASLEEMLDIINNVTNDEAIHIVESVLTDNELCLLGEAFNANELSLNEGILRSIARRAADFGYGIKHTARRVNGAIKRASAYAKSGKLSNMYAKENKAEVDAELNKIKDDKKSTKTEYKTYKTGLKQYIKDAKINGNINNAKEKKAAYTEYNNTQQDTTGKSADDIKKSYKDAAAKSTDRSKIAYALYVKPKIDLHKQKENDDISKEKNIVKTKRENYDHDFRKKEINKFEKKIGFDKPANTSNATNAQAKQANATNAQAKQANATNAQAKQANATNAQAKQANATDTQNENLAITNIDITLALDECGYAVTVEDIKLIREEIANGSYDDYIKEALNEAEEAELTSTSADELLGTKTDAEDIETDEDSLKDLKAKEDEIDVNASADAADTTEHLVDEAFNIALNDIISMLSEDFETTIPEAGSKETADESDLKSIPADELLGTKTDAEDIETDEDDLANLEKADDETIDANKSADKADATEHLVDESYCYYGSLTEAAELPVGYFNNDLHMDKLTTQVACTIAKENDDLLYSELERAIATAKVIKEKIVTKYGDLAKEKAKAFVDGTQALQDDVHVKRGLFAHLGEQIEINSAKQNLPKLNESEVIYSNEEIFDSYFDSKK